MTKVQRGALTAKTNPLCQCQSLHPLGGRDSPSLFGNVTPGRHVRRPLSFQLDAMQVPILVLSDLKRHFHFPSFCLHDSEPQVF